MREFGTLCKRTLPRLFVNNIIAKLSEAVLVYRLFFFLFRLTDVFSLTIFSLKQVAIELRPAACHSRAIRPTVMGCFYSIENLKDSNLLSKFNGSQSPFQELVDMYLFLF